MYLKFLVFIKFMSDDFPNKTQRFKIGIKCIVFVGLKTINLFLAHHFLKKYPKVGCHQTILIPRVNIYNNKY